MRFNYILKLFLVSVVVLMMSACDNGGGGDTPSVDNGTKANVVKVEDNKTQSSPIEIKLNDNVVIQEETLKITSFDATTTSNSVTIDGDINNSDGLIDKIVFLPPDDKQNGTFMKVSSITKEVNATNGKIVSKVSYVVPQLNEVISELKIEERNIMEDDNISI